MGVIGKVTVYIVGFSFRICGFLLRLGVIESLIRQRKKKKKRFYLREFFNWSFERMCKYRRFQQMRALQLSSCCSFLCYFLIMISAFLNHPLCQQAHTVGLTREGFSDILKALVKEANDWPHLRYVNGNLEGRGLKNSILNDSLPMG